MIWNELSIQGGPTSQEEMYHKISQWLRVCQKLFREREDRELYYTLELMTGELGGGFTIHDWLEDSKVLRQEKAFFRTLINRGRLLKESDFLGSELIVEDACGERRRAIGCLAAYESESYVVSMDTSVLWQAEEIVGTYVSLGDDDREVAVANCCTEGQVRLLEEKEKKRLRLLISSGKELWEKREALYPHLLFCDSVRKQLGGVSLSLHLQMIMKRIQILEDYFMGFDGRFDKNKLGYSCRRESETVENDDKLRRLRLFQTPYGKEEFFSWHISFTGNFPGRIHFMPDAKHKVGIVGYIGKHLPTGRFPTI